MFFYNRETIFGLKFTLLNFVQSLELLNFTHGNILIEDKDRNKRNFIWQIPKS